MHYFAMKPHAVIILGFLCFTFGRIEAQSLSPRQPCPPTPSDCIDLFLGAEIGTPLLSSWSQTATGTPSVPGSPFYALSSVGEFSPIFNGFYAGLTFAIRTQDKWMPFISFGFSRVLVNSSSFANGADQDVSSGVGGTTVLGQLQIQNIKGTVDYYENTLGLHTPPFIFKFFYISLALSTNYSLSDLNFSWDSKITNPANGVFLTTNSNQRTDTMDIAGVKRLRVGARLGLGCDINIGTQWLIQPELMLNDWFTSAVGDGAAIDASRQFTQGTSDFAFTSRSLQNLLNLRVSVLFKFY